MPSVVLRCLWLLLAVLALSACKKDPYTIDSETVAAPAGSRWSAASAKLHYEPRRSGGHGVRYARFRLELYLQAGGKSKRIALDSYTEGDKPGDTPSSKFRALHDTEFSLQFAPDGHALGLSLDGGKSYALVALDAGDHPLYCRHTVFDLKSGWKAVPKTRDVVLEILASADPPAGTSPLHLEPGEHPAGRGRFDSELERAIDFADAHLKDATVREAVIAALIRPGNQIFQAGSLTACAARIAAEHPDQRRRLLAAVRSGPREQRRRAAHAVAKLADEEVESALVAGLKDIAKPCTARTAECVHNRFQRLAPAWALASVVTARAAMSEAALTQLLDRSRDSDAAMQIYAARGLAASDDARAKSRLEAMAVGACNKPLSAWSTTFVADNEAAKDKRDPACWARAALARGQ